MDLSKVTFPTFVLEPRSMLECMTDFMAHPVLMVLIFGWVSHPGGCSAAPICTPHICACAYVVAPLPGTNMPIVMLFPFRASHSYVIFRPNRSTDRCEDPKEHFIQYYAGRHIEPKGDKKPWAIPFSLPFACLTPLLSTRICLCTINTTPSWASSSDAAMTTRMARGGFTSQSKVRLYSCSVPRHTFIFTRSPQFHIIHLYPPSTTFHLRLPANKVAIVGELRPKSKFLGKSVSTTMEGAAYR
jgi:hypothetical protein